MINKMKELKAQIKECAVLLKLLDIHKKAVPNPNLSEQEKYDFVLNNNYLLNTIELKLSSYRPEIIKLANKHNEDSRYIANMIKRIKELKEKFEKQDLEAFEEFQRLKEEKKKEDDEIFIFLIAVFFGYIKIIPDFNFEDLLDSMNKSVIEARRINKQTTTKKGGLWNKIF